jgi:hypothetical protein
MPNRSPHPTRRVGLAALPLIAALLVGGCAGPAPEPPAPAPLQLAGTWTGSITVDANFLPTTLVVTQAAEGIEVRLTVPDLGAVTQGTGTASPDRFSFRVPYELNCPGEATFEGHVDAEDGQAIVGTLRAVDCDSVLNGTFRFTRTGG